MFSHAKHTGYSTNTIQNALFKFLVDCKQLDKSEFEGGICNIHSFGARDFSPSYGLAPRVFVGLKSHAPIDFVARQLPIYRTAAARFQNWGEKYNNVEQNQAFFVP